MTEEELESWFLDSLGACGCGDPVSVFRMVQEILEAFDADEKASLRGDPWHYPSDGVRRRWDALPWSKREGDNHDAWVEHPAQWLVLYWLNHIELCEHGGSVRAGWLTNKGQEVLAAMREHGHAFLALP